MSVRKMHYCPVLGRLVKLRGEYSPETAPNMQNKAICQIKAGECSGNCKGCTLMSAY